MEIEHFINEEKNLVVGKDEDGWFIGKIIGDIVARKHYVDAKTITELIIRWDLNV